MRPSRVHDLIPLVNGLFSHMDYQFWDFTSDELDILMQSRFGQRPVAPLIDIIQGPPVEPCFPRSQLTDFQLSLLASIILKTYRNKWDRLGALHSLEYDVLKNYLDEYQEVLRDDTDSSTSRDTSSATDDSQVSQLTTSSGSSGEQSNVSSNESTNRRNDDFASEFSRVSKDSQIRTDDLEESKVKSEESNEKRTDNLQESLTRDEDTDSTRTDNLTDSLSGNKQSNKSYSGGNYSERVERDLDAAGGDTSNTSLYGFNSTSPVGDTANDSGAVKSEDEVTVKTFTGSKSETESETDTSTNQHTGTQRTVTTVDESSTRTNTGTQTTNKDVDEAYIKANRGSQSIDEDTSISDSTHTNDEQESSSVSHGATSGKTLSESVSDTSNSMDKRTVSRLNDSIIVNSALARAKQSIHRGNIGNLTPQQLITQEIELWRWNFIDEVLNDIKSMITLPIYI